MAQSKSVGRRPLEGVRVIDLTKIVAGPNATRMLATMGAEVIRVEWNDQRALDLLRGVRPVVAGGDGDNLNRSGLFNNINPGKYGITLNLSLPQGRDLLRRQGNRAVRELQPRADGPLGTRIWRAVQN
jgi:CoA:oxalate CoA-transferase